MSNWTPTPGLYSPLFMAVTMRAAAMASAVAEAWDRVWVKLATKRVMKPCTASPRQPVLELLMRVTESTKVYWLMRNFDRFLAALRQG